MKSRRLRRWCLGIWLAGLGGPALAACNLANPLVSLGTIDSLSLRTSQPQAAASGGLRCDGILAVLTAGYAQVTLTTSPLQLQSGAYQIPFQIYSDAAYSQPLPNAVPLGLSNLTLIGIGGSASAVPLFYKVQLGANVPAGTYSATVTLNWQWAICTVGALNLCVWQRSAGLTQSCTLGICGAPTNWGAGETSTVNLTLVVSKACLIGTVAQLDFGTQALVSQFGSVSQSVQVTCTLTEGYLVGFDNGQHYSAPWRRMNSAGNYLRYQLYKAGTATVWDNATQTSAASGTGLAQGFSYDAKVDSGQPNVPVGIYTDNITLIISY